MQKFIALMILLLLVKIGFSIEAPSYPSVNDTVLVYEDTNSEELYALNSSDGTNLQTEEPKNPKAPGRLPSFWWSFVLSIVGSYSIYAIGLGPISVLVVYFASKRNKIEVRKSMWGWIIGTVAGVGLYLLLHL